MFAWKRWCTLVPSKTTYRDMISKIFIRSFQQKPKTFLKTTVVFRDRRQISRLTLSQLVNFYPP